MQYPRLAATAIAILVLGGGITLCHAQAVPASPNISPSGSDGSAAQPGEPGQISSEQPSQTPRSSPPEPHPLPAPLPGTGGRPQEDARSFGPPLPPDLARERRLSIDAELGPDGKPGVQPIDSPIDAAIGAIPGTELGIAKEVGKAVGDAAEHYVGKEAGKIIEEKTTESADEYIKDKVKQAGEGMVDKAVKNSRENDADKVQVNVDLLVHPPARDFSPPQPQLQNSPPLGGGNGQGVGGQTDSSMQPASVTPPTGSAAASPSPVSSGTGLTLDCVLQGRCHVESQPTPENPYNKVIVANEDKTSGKSSSASAQSPSKGNSGGEVVAAAARRKLDSSCTGPKCGQAPGKTPELAPSASLPAGGAPQKRADAIAQPLGPGNDGVELKSRLTTPHPERSKINQQKGHPPVQRLVRPAPTTPGHRVDIHISHPASAAAIRAASTSSSRASAAAAGRAANRAASSAASRAAESSTSRVATHASARAASAAASRAAAAAASHSVQVRIPTIQVRLPGR